MKLKFLKWDVIDLKLEQISSLTSTFHGMGGLSPGKCEFRSPIRAWACAVPTMYRTLKTNFSLGYNFWIYLFDFSLCESLLLCSSVLEPNFNLKIRVKTGRLHSNSTCVSVRESSLENSARSGIVRYCFSANLDSSRSSCSLENGVRGFRSRLCLLKFEMRVGLFSSDFGGDLEGGEAEPSDESKWRCKDLDQFSIFFTKVWPDTNLFTLPWLYNVRF